MVKEHTWYGHYNLIGLVEITHNLYGTLPSIYSYLLILKL
jgi:hypothetical protein